ncbi:MAG: serpin family protein [Myxococcota bacterium]
MTLLPALLLACAGSQKPEPEALSEPAPTPAPVESSVASGTITAQPQLSRAAPGPTYSASATDFALRFHSELGDGNTAESGVSAQIALSMLAAGAAGETLEEFATAFGADVDDTWHVDQVRAMAAYNDTPGIELTVVNGLWTQQGRPLKEPYVQRLTSDYLAAPSELDFSANAAGAADTINAWTREHTRDRIQKLFDAGDVQGAELVLANAIAFKGTWETKFDATLTTEDPFSAPTGKVNVPTMHGKIDGLSYVEGDGFRAIALPYVQRGAAMIVVLPNEGVALADVEAKLDQSQLGRLTMSGRRPVNVSLPKWQAEYSHDLDAPLRALGLDSAFTGGDFSGMSDRPLKIDSAVQKVFVQVDEEGTEAAAVTGIVMKTTSLPPQPVDFVVDRPFFWAIWHVETRTPLFTGRVVDPT